MEKKKKRRRRKNMEKKKKEREIKEREGQRVTGWRMGLAGDGKGDGGVGGEVWGRRWKRRRWWKKLEVVEVVEGGDFERRRRWGGGE